MQIVRTRVGLRGWIGVGVSICCVLIATLACLGFSSLLLDRQVEIAVLRSQRLKNYVGTRQVLDRTLRRPKLLQHADARLFLGRWLPEMRRPSAAVVVAAADVLSILRTSPSSENQNALLNLSIALSDDPSPGSAALRNGARIREKLFEFREATQTALELDEQVRDFKRGLENLRTQSKLVAADFGALLSLVPENEPSRIGAYQHGILRDLPRLQALPDNVTDLPELALLLERAGGKVVIEAADQHAAFVARLEELRRIHQEILRSDGQQQTRLTEVSERLAGTLQELRGSGDFLEEHLCKLVITAFSPRENFILTFDALKSALRA